MNRSMPAAIIAQIQAYGFDVYMRTPADSWLHFARGNDIGYLQHDPISGYSLSTVHKPNESTGAGFDMGREMRSFDKAALESCFIVAPNWVSSRDRGTVVKYRDMDEFINADAFKREYKLVGAASV